MKVSKVLAFFAVAMASACVGGGRSETKAEKFVDNLNVEDTYYSYHLTKDPTKQYGYVVISRGDGTDWAVDLTDADYYDDIDLFNDSAFRVYYNTNGYYEDIYGNLYEKTTEVSKDLEKVGAVMQKVRAKDMGEQLSANYGLSESKGIELGTLLAEYKDLKKQRALTDADSDRFLKAAFGVSTSEATHALETYSRGDLGDMNSLIEKSSNTLGTTPEHVRDIMQTELLKQ